MQLISLGWCMEGLSTVSQRHRIAEPRRDLWRLSAPKSTEIPATARSAGKHPGNLGLKTSKDENSTVQSAWQEKWFFNLVFKLFLVFPFMTIVFCSVTGHHLVHLLYSFFLYALKRSLMKINQIKSNQISTLSAFLPRDPPILIHLWGPWANVTVSHCGSILTMDEVILCVPRERWMFGGTFLCPRLQLTGITIHSVLQVTEGVTRWYLSLCTWCSSKSSLWELH